MLVKVLLEKWTLTFIYCINNQINNKNFNMKSRSFRFLISALAIAGFLFAACNKDELKPGIDTSLPGAEGLAYDETNGGDNMIALIWNSDKAIAAGATSFTVQLVTDLSQGGDIYSTMSQTFAVDPNGINNAVKFEGLKTGSQFYARARANYPGSRMSDWIYVTSSSDTSSPYLMTVSGKVTTLKAKLLKATSSTLSFQFTISDYLTGATDIAETYNAGIYKDKACTDLVVSWVLQNTANGQNAALKWTQTDGARFVFAGLSPNTTYYMKVVDVTDSEKPIEAESVVEAKTLAFSPVSLPTSTAAAGDVILAEDFSEFPWGGTLADNENCPGHSLLDRSTATALTAATGSNPVATEKGIGYYLCATGQNMGLFNTLGAAIPSTRLSNWGYHNEGDASGIGALCAMPGCLQIGASSKTAQIVTPELNCLNGTATLTVSYDVQAESTDPNRDFFVDVITKSNISTYCVTYSDADCVNVADSVYNNNTTMTTKTIDIPNVPVGARLAFGGRRVPSTSGQQRFFFDNLIIKVKSYGSTHIDIATPVVTLTANAENIIASWDAAQNATSYTVEYKKTADANWTVAGTTQNLTYTIDNLSSETSYDVRVKGVNGDSESSYSTTVSTTTLKKAAFPKNIANADELIALLTGSEVSTASATDVVNITADIDMNGKTLTSTAVFAGVLNGNNHSIKNWKGTTPLFATLGSAQDLTIDATCSLEPTSFPFGALAATSTGKISNVTNNAKVTYSLSADATEDIILGSIIGTAEGDMEQCTNSGDVTVKGDVALKSTLVGGVVGLAKGKLSNCTNTGVVTLSAKTLSAISTFNDLTNVSILYGGIAAASKSTVENCNNSGKISYNISNIENFTITKMGRPLIGGIVAAPNGDITGCSNTGAIDVNIFTGDRSAFTAAEYTLCLGGISGGDYYATKQNTTNITSCTNEGKISVDMDCAKANSAFGGIVGWPGVEGSSQTILVKSCTNKGDLSLKGAGKARLGGIAGGAGNIESSKNYGAITVNSSTASCTAGGIEGFASQNLKFISNENYGDVVNASSSVAYVGGLIANYGNVASTIGDSCIVNCKLSTLGDTSYAGMVIGYFNGTSKPITFATAANPVKVSGTYTTSEGTVTITAANFNTVLKGTNKNSSVQTINAVFGE
jgi:hypothetical protein